MEAKKLAHKLRKGIELEIYRCREDLVHELERNNYTKIWQQPQKLGFKDEANNRWHFIIGLGGRFEYKKEQKIRPSKKISLACVNCFRDGLLNLKNLPENAAFIYALVSLCPNGETGAYIGQTTQLNRRISDHLNNKQARWSYYLKEWSEQNRADTYLVVLEHVHDSRLADLMEFVWVKTAEQGKVTLPESGRWAMRAHGKKPPYPIRRWLDSEWIRKNGILLIKRFQ